jgi:hypothetical protein
VPNAVVEAALRGGARVTAEFASASPRLDELFATVFETNTIYWEFVASQQAYHILNGYGVVAATTGDSTGAYNPSTLFMVVAWNSAGTQYWSSSPTGGYSVDNLAPVTPAPFTGNYGGGATHLHWNPNVEADLAHYRLYRGSDPSFVPGPGNLIATPPDTGFADAGAAGSCYKLSAVDAHGNESGFALLTPAGTVSVSEGVVSLALSSPWPNPSAGRVTFALTLPTEGAARLALHDAAGRRVRQFLAGMQTAGEHSVTWDGRDDRGQALAAGRYYLRLEASGRVLARSIVRLE